MITRVKIKNFRAIRECDVALQPLTFLVGPNGSGKSSFLDALAFVADALNFGVYSAFDKRGGKKVVSHKSEEDKVISFEFDIEGYLSDEERAHFSYRLDICPTERGMFELREFYWSPDHLTHFFERVGTRALVRGQDVPLNSRHLLYLQTDNSAYGALSWLRNTLIYDFDTRRIREPIANQYNPELSIDGSNLAARWTLVEHSTRVSVLTRMKKIVPHLADVQGHNIGGTDFLEFVFHKDERAFFSLPAGAVSSGILNLFAVLVSLSQPYRASLVTAIEEPEVSMFPPSLYAMLGAFFEASSSRQVIISTHSPDLLDDAAIEPNQVVHASVARGEVILRTIDEAAAEAIKRGDFTVGELLRMGQLERPLQEIEGLLGTDS